MRHIRSIGAICPTLLWISMGAVHAQTYYRTVNVQDPRPVAKAAERIETLYGTSVTYEDAPYLNSGELVDVTAQVRAAPQEDGVTKNPVMIPRGGSLSFTYFEEQLSSSRPDVEILRPMVVREAMQSALSAFAAIRGTELFALEQAGERFHVVPTHFLNSGGQIQQLTPLLDTLVTISSQQRSALALIQEICRSLAVTTSQTVVVGTVPQSLLATRITTLSSSQDKARNLLDRLFNDIDVPLSWQLFYDPSLRWYVLNIHSVTSKQ